jgi:hypothetical protein
MSAKQVIEEQRAAGASLLARAMAAEEQAAGKPFLFFKNTKKSLMARALAAKEQAAGKSY